MSDRPEQMFQVGDEVVVTDERIEGAYGLNPYLDTFKVVSAEYIEVDPDKLDPMAAAFHEGRVPVSRWSYELASDEIDSISVEEHQITLA